MKYHLASLTLEESYRPDGEVSGSLGIRGDDNTRISIGLSVGIINAIKELVKPLVDEVGTTLNANTKSWEFKGKKS